MGDLPFPGLQKGAIFSHHVSYSGPSKAFLRPHPDYEAHLESVPNDFAYLPEEIVYDICEIMPPLRQRFKPCTADYLMKFSGPWGNVCRKWQHFSWHLREASRLSQYYWDFSSRSIDWASATKDISYSYIDNSESCKHNVDYAHRLYEVVSIRTRKSEICPDFMDRLGDKFTSVHLSMPLSSAVERFLKRVLKSSHLRDLKLNKTKCPTDQEFQESLVAFVKRPTCQSLLLWYKPSAETDAMNLNVVKAVLKARAKWHVTQVHQKILLVGTYLFLEKVRKGFRKKNKVNAKKPMPMLARTGAKKRTYLRADITKTDVTEFYELRLSTVSELSEEI
ncbi:hypothetical protein L596_021515 [Steinernema carpocapsae]|uniref:Uncharacterized protein n=1 Tax=Steinernema carpocapsae TaxID=34508 RepID=A0A4U5MJ22_STECR|nr:hypothetical protein L596_021515 [Steinernema carpocapsae]